MIYLLSQEILQWVNLRGTPVCICIVVTSSIIVVVSILLYIPTYDNKQQIIY